MSDYSDGVGGLEDLSIKKANKSMDKRRESSRYAARDRRGKEAEIFDALKEEVPMLDDDSMAHVDRIALLRVASTLCLMRKSTNKFLKFNTEVSEIQKERGIWSENSLNESLDGFVMIIGADGGILYVTESISVYLGVTQTDLIGNSLKDYVHESDYRQFAQHKEDTMILRMKSLISPRGRILNMKSAVYKAIICQCRHQLIGGKAGERISLIHGYSSPAGSSNLMHCGGGALGEKGVVEETNGMYMTRHTCDMRFSYVSENLNLLLRHDSRSLMGTSFYSLVHPADLSTIIPSFRELFSKQHCCTPFYRLLGTNSSVVWVQSEAITMSHTVKGQKIQYVLVVHTVFGMQSELDSWTSPLNNVRGEAGAAVPAIINIKTEIEDVPEYFGSQSAFVDCYDFTPLIEPRDSFLWASDYYRPVPIQQNPQVVIQPVQFNQPWNTGNTSNNMDPLAVLDEGTNRQLARRKSSYEEVLQWLFRDESDSPPPPMYEEETDARESIRLPATHSSINYQVPQQTNKNKPMGTEFADYQECEQLGAELAPYLPHEDMFKLGGDCPLSLDIDGLFPDFDMSEFTVANKNQVESYGPNGSVFYEHSNLNLNNEPIAKRGRFN